LASEKPVLSMISAVSEIFRLHGDFRNFGRSCRLWLKLAGKFECHENTCAALLAIVKFYGVKEWVKVLKYK
jgi:hypothetical protein